MTSETEIKVRLDGSVLHLTEEILRELGWKNEEELAFEVIPPVLRLLPKKMDRESKERLLWLLNTCYSCRFYDEPGRKCTQPENGGMSMGPEDYCQLYERKPRPQNEAQA